MNSDRVSRRSFLKGAGVSVAAAGMGTAAFAETEKESGVPMAGPGLVTLEFVVNGKKRKAAVLPSATLLDTFRDELDLTGAKRVCDRGACGACTMIVDGRAVNSCTMLAIDARGKTIRTVEGLDVGGKLTPLQEAFVECDALQCGFCTPGMVMACTAVLEENPSPTRQQVAEGIAGNICRCGTYQNIFEAVELTVARSKAKGGSDGK